MLSKKIKIVIADDHRIFREGLKLMLAGVTSVDVIGEAADGAQLIALVASTAPDVIITDVKMPNLTGTEAVKILCAKYPGIRIIALTSFGEDQQIIEMIEAGAMGFLSKNIVHEELVSAINSVYQHNAYFSQSITERLSMPDFIPSTQEVKYDLSDYLRGSDLERANIYKILNSIVDAEGNPAITIDEIRQAEELIK